MRVILVLSRPMRVLLGLPTLRMAKVAKGAVRAVAAALTIDSKAHELRAVHGHDTNPVRLPWQRNDKWYKTGNNKMAPSSIEQGFLLLT